PEFAAAHALLHPGPYVRLQLRDTGHGMAPELLERIFEPFFTTKDVGEGTGMGLAVVDGIIANHQGAITVTSTPGQGTTFTIYLPQLSHPAPRLAVPDDTPIPEGHAEILFVDDEPALTHMAEEMLTRLGYQVTAHTSSVAALAAFRAAPW